MSENRFGLTSEASGTGGTPVSRIRVRAAAVSDTDTITSFNLAMARETEDKELDRAVLRAGVQAALEDRSKCLYFVAEVDGQVAGQIMVTYEWSDWRNGNIWWIQSVYVASPFRRRGVFRALYEKVRSEAVAANAVAIRLYVERDNKVAQKTYENLGMSLSDYLVMEEGLLQGALKDLRGD